MELRRIGEDVVTEVIFPERIGWKTESRGSAFCVTGMISGSPLQTVLEVLPATNDCRCLEKSESAARDG